MKILDKKLLKTISIETIILMLIAHGFVYFNIMFSHDSISVFHGGYYGDSIGIGRFLIPVWNYIRGEYYPPYLIGVLSIIIFIAINYFVIKIFDIKDKGLILAICGIFTTCVSYTLLNATYINYSDMYAFSILLNVLAIFLMRRKDRISILAILLLFISLGLYQAYIGITIGFSIILLIIDLLNKEEAKKVIKKGIIYVVQIVISLFLYYIAVKLIPRFTHIELETYYNSVSNFGNFGGFKNFIKIILGTYTNFFNTLIVSKTFHRTIVTVINGILLLLFLFIFIKKIITSKLKGSQIILLILLLLVLPFGFNIIYFMSNGIVHELMYYPIFTSFIFILYILQNIKNEKIMYFVYFLLLVSISSNIFYANQVYEKKMLEFESTKLVMNRIINRIEEIPEYEPGKTPIFFVGELNKGPIKVKKDKFDYKQVGSFTYYATTYPQTYYRFIYYYLGYPINLYDNDDAVEKTAEYRKNPEVKEMGVFPASDSVKMIDGTIVVKLS